MSNDSQHPKSRISLNLVEAMEFHAKIEKKGRMIPTSKLSPGIRADLEKVGQLAHVDTLAEVDPVDILHLLREPHLFRVFGFPSPRSSCVETATTKPKGAKLVEYLSIASAAHYVSCSEEDMVKLLNNDFIPSSHVKWGRRVSLADLDVFLEMEKARGKYMSQLIYDSQFIPEQPFDENPLLSCNRPKDPPAP